MFHQVYSRQYNQASKAHRSQKLNNLNARAELGLVRVPSPVYRFPLFGPFCKQGMAREGLYSGFFNFGHKSLLTESFYPAGLFKI